MVSSAQRRILLASASPRRRELLARVGFDPVVSPTDVPEVREQAEPPDAYTRRLARLKARAAADGSGADAPRWVLAADTVVVYGETVLEKPSDHADAVRMLTNLAGDEHDVVTSFCWLDRDPGTETETEAARTVSTRVHCRDVSEEWIRRYVDTGEPMDKAGGYGIQDVGGTLVRSVEGSYSAVVGLPLCEVVETLEELGGLDDFPFGPRRT